MFRVLWNVIKIIGPCNIPAMLIAYLIVKYIPSVILATFVGAIIYIIVYFGLLWSFLPYYDKSGLIKNTIKNYVRRKN